MTVRHPSFDAGTRHDYHDPHPEQRFHYQCDSHGHAIRGHGLHAGHHAHPPTPHADVSHAPTPQADPGHAPAPQADPGHAPVAGFDGGDLAHLFGQLPLFGGVAIIPVDHLTINNNQFTENHLTENNSIVFNAAPGGTVDVGGDVSALSAQNLDVQSLSTSHASGSELGWGDAAWGEAGGFEAVLFGHMPGLGGAGPGPLVIMPVDHLTINNNSFVQNFETENTNVVFNAAAGGTVDVGGDVNALSSQTGEIGHQPHDAHFA